MTEGKQSTDVAYDKLKSLIEKLKEQRGIDAPVPTPIKVNFFKVTPEGPKRVPGSLLLRPDGTYRVPEMKNRQKTTKKRRRTKMRTNDPSLQPGTDEHGDNYNDLPIEINSDDSTVLDLGDTYGTDFEALARTGWSGAESHLSASRPRQRLQRRANPSTPRTRGSRP